MFGMCIMLRVSVLQGVAVCCSCVCVAECCKCVAVRCNHDSSICVAKLVSYVTVGFVYLRMCMCHMSHLCV